MFFIISNGRKKNMARIILWYFCDSEKLMLFITFQHVLHVITFNIADCYCTIYQFGGKEQQDKNQPKKDKQQQQKEHEENGEKSRRYTTLISISGFSKTYLCWSKSMSALSSSTKRSLTYMHKPILRVSVADNGQLSKLRLGCITGPVFNIDLSSNLRFWCVCARLRVCECVRLCVCLCV